jgi:hypothetical protein
MKKLFGLNGLAILPIALAAVMSFSAQGSGVSYTSTFEFEGDSREEVLLSAAEKFNNLKDHQTDRGNRCLDEVSIVDHTVTSQPISKVYEGSITRAGYRATLEIEYRCDGPQPRR